MKQTNKLLNILNIISTIFIVLLLILDQSYTLDIYVDYFILVIFINYIILNLFNFIVGIKNLKRHNKKIGIISIVMILPFLSILIAKYIEKETLIFIPNWVNILIIVLNVVIFPILAIMNLIKNRKLENATIKKYKKILFYFIILIWISILIIPIILTKIDLNNISKVINILENQKDNKVLIYSSYNYNNGYFCEFYDEEGNLFNKKYYELIAYDQFQKNLKDYITIPIIKENGKEWLIDYKGEKLERIYSLFGTISSDELSHLISIGNYKLDRSYVYNDLAIPITSEQVFIEDNVLIFGEWYDDYQIRVEILEEPENDTSYANDILEISKDESLNELQKLYLYKKKYYLITEDGSEKELDCNNLLFTTNGYYELAIQTYSNNYIPYYDNDSTGFFNLNGEKIAYNKRYLVYDAMETYQIIYDNLKNSFYYKPYENNNLMEIKGTTLKFYNNDFIISEYGIYKIYNNVIKQISNDKYYYPTKFKFINMNIKDIKTINRPYYNLIN